MYRRLQRNRHLRAWIGAVSFAITPVLLLLVASTSAFAVDTDHDGVDDAVDNCITIPNPDQRDTDADGFGNRCDADLNNDGVVNVADLGLMRAAFLGPRQDADLNGDGVVNIIDLSILKSLFLKPPGPSAVTAISAKDAARFLSQAAFGATTAEINRVRTRGFDRWLTDQVALPPSRLLPAARAIDNVIYDHCINTPPATGCGDDPRTFIDSGSDNFRYAWWQQVVAGNDQLRQRVAFALSEIFVVSDVPPPLQSSRYGVASFYDLLVDNAFGNYRTLLAAISRHPVMGIYLSHVGNQKADLANNIRPDENYAREVLQLFSIGVQKLNTNGTPIRDASNVPIPTYNQAMVEEFARVFTGWYYAGIDWGAYFGDGDRKVAMVPHEEFHDTGVKQLLNGEILPAGQTAAQDMDAAINNIFNHPNVGPFIGRLLIQRLVTSNPTPAYVNRVAMVFNNNGRKVRGDLRAVVRAILLDPEARKGPQTVPNFGKLREPLLRLAHVWRAFNAVPIPGGAYNFPPTLAVYNSPGVWSGLLRFEEDIGQNVLHSPSVFNFFQSNYAPAGAVRTAGLVAPEFQIATENNVMALANTINFHVLDAARGGDWTWLDLHEEILLAGNPDALLDHLDMLLTAGSMTPELRSVIRNHLLTGTFDAGPSGLDQRVRDAIALIVNSPEYLVQQ